jgi:crotonobetainyl-CoA:carnitine CoA-transferase CaiB-like acyl-CoA transferase
VTGPLDGLLVVSLEQAVAAPYCASRLADAGARVIKIERPEGDFARGYDRAARGQSAYFVWLNRGKESIALDIKAADDKGARPRAPASTAPSWAPAIRASLPATSAATARQGPMPR